MNTKDTTVAATTAASSMADSQFATGIACAIGGTFLFAMKSIFIKFAFAAGGTTIVILTLRLLISLPFYCAILTYLLWKQNAQDATTSDRQPLTVRLVGVAMGLGFLGYYLAALLDVSGLAMISAQLERLTLFTYPTMIAVLAWMFLGEELNRRIILALVLCYAGVFLMYTKEQGMTSGSNIKLGVFLVMCSALSYSRYILFAKPTMQRIGSKEFTSLAMIGSTVFVFIHFLATESIGGLFRIPVDIWMYCAILAFVCTVIPSYLISEAIIRLGATRTTVIGSVGPVFTMILAIIFLREPSSVFHFVGMGLAIFGVTFVMKK